MWGSGLDHGVQSVGVQIRSWGQGVGVRIILLAQGVGVQIRSWEQGVGSGLDHGGRV